MMVNLLFTHENTGSEKVGFQSFYLVDIFGALKEAHGVTVG